MKRPVALIHTSPAAIPPLAEYYRRQAPELEITNLLEDGLLRFLASGNETAVEERLQDLLCVARDVYQCELAMLTCSAVSRQLIRRLSNALGLPILKIDEALARKAVQAGPRLGVIVTFPPAQPAASKLLRDMAAEAERTLELSFRVIPQAYEALLGGQEERHDELLIHAVAELDRLGLDAIVLAQVSMARILGKLPQTQTPVLSSLAASLEAIRESLAAAAGSNPRRT